MVPANKTLATSYTVSIVAKLCLHLQRFNHNFQWKVSRYEWTRISETVWDGSQDYYSSL